MIISQNIRDLFAQHIDVMLPLLVEDPAAVEAFTSIVMGGDPILSDSFLHGNDGKLYAGHAVTMACALSTELAVGEPSLNRPEWESRAIKFVKKVLQFHANQTNNL